jgi:hypothetical protein
MATFPIFSWRGVKGRTFFSGMADRLLRVAV